MIPALIALALAQEAPPEGPAEGAAEGTAEGAAEGPEQGPVGAPVEPPVALPLPNARPGRDRPSGPAPRYGTTGFRLSVPAGGTAATTRLAFVQDFDGAAIGEVTLRGQAAWQHVGLAAELSGTAAASDRWTGAGLGNLLIDARYLVGRGATHAIGLRVVAPTGARDGAHGDIAWWGTVPQATVPMWGVALAYSGATERWAWHTHTGFRAGGTTGILLGELLDVVASLATVQPVAPGWDVVAEVEVMVGPSPLHVRALARHDLGHGWEADLGLAVPVAVFFADPTLQIIGRVERRW